MQGELSCACSQFSDQGAHRVSVIFSGTCGSKEILNISFYWVVQFRQVNKYLCSNNNLIDVWKNCARKMQGRLKFSSLMGLCVLISWPCGSGAALLVLSSTTELLLWPCRGPSRGDEAVWCGRGAACGEQCLQHPPRASRFPDVSAGPSPRACELKVQRAEAQAPSRIRSPRDSAPLLPVFQDSLCEISGK